MAPNRASRTGNGSRLRVLLLLSWLNGGGAERVSVHLMNRLDPARFDVRMGLLRRAGAYLPLVDPARVYHRDWGEDYFPAEGADRSFYAPHRPAMSAMVAPLVYRSIIREALSDVAMSFAKGTNLVVGLATALLGRERPAWIAREGNNVLRATSDEASGPLGIRVAKALTRRCYRAADCILVNAREMIGACGTAALAADCDFRPRELIRHDVSGWLVPPEDVDALAGAFDRLLPDESLRARLGAGGKKRAEQLRLDAIVPLYATLLEEQAAPRRAGADATSTAYPGPGAPLLEGAD